MCFPDFQTKTDHKCDFSLICAPDSFYQLPAENIHSKPSIFRGKIVILSFILVPSLHCFLFSDFFVHSVSQADF